MSVKIKCIDCLKGMAELPDKSIDMVMCDPPYGTTACKWDSVIPLAGMWDELERLCKKGSAIVLNATQPFTSTLLLSNQCNYKHSWVWNKGVGANFMHAKRQPLKTTEDVLVFGYGTVRYYPIMTPRDKPLKKSNNNVGESSGYTINSQSNKYVGKIYTEKYPNVLLNFPSNSLGSKSVHPTQKPIALMEYLIATYTNEGDTVLDFTMGSGTTGVACKNLKRSFIGFENNKEYYQIAKKRIITEYKKP